MRAMVQIISWGERWNVPFNEFNGRAYVPSFTEWKYFVPLHEWETIHYLFYITCTKIQNLKQI